MFSSRTEKGDHENNSNPCFIGGRRGAVVEVTMKAEKAVVITFPSQQSRT
jgi:hypothetical protein